MRDAQHEDEQNQKEELKKVLDNPPNSLTYFKEEPVTENQRQAEKERVKQRWKILCLVKTSDRVGDEHLKQEKLKERVDEWMSSMVNQMRLVEESHEQQQNGNIPDDKVSTYLLFFQSFLARSVCPLFKAKKVCWLKVLQM